MRRFISALTFLNRPQHLDLRFLLPVSIAVAVQLLLFASIPVRAQELSSASSPNALTTTDTNRFVAAHGQRSVIMGYPQQGLEVWAYPLQLVSNYRIGFLDNGASTEADAPPLLRRLIYAPDSITRIYAGPDYVVRERLFVPIGRVPGTQIDDPAAAIITYEVDSEHPLDIVVHFDPSLTLMWPGAIGGQYTQWDPQSASYVIGESGLAGTAASLSALVASPETVAHDPTINSTFDTGQHYSFTIHPHAATDPPGPATASVYLAQLPNGQSAASTLQTLVQQASTFQTEAAAHYASLKTEDLQLQTPDEQVNSAFAWAEIALDQAWVCNPQLGCGIVAGYGPSRSGHRPQYDWFFGGDGLIATNALISAGNYHRAREELEFIIKYQDAKTGMVWHELSQSAGYIDWSKYPYMFVHVDITFDYLKTVARYVASSGDTRFLRDHWPSIAMAYQYCQSVIDPRDHYPHIPAGKEGGDEQHRPADDLGLSASWVAAARAYAQLAATAGHPQDAAAADQQANLARTSIAAHYWNDKENFWFDGHNHDGAPIFTRRSGFGEAIDEKIFSPPQINALLDQIASAKFQSDWGVRGAAPSTASYNPWSYTTASTTAPQTDYLADTYWQNHRPDIALAIWRSILPWNSIDSLGHIPELLAGNYYIEQTESVPEQTWCSAAFLDSTIRGLLGLESHGGDNAITFRPHLPAEWDQVSVANLKLPHSTLALNLHQDIASLDLTIHNRGAAADITFDPEVPLGAKVTAASCNDRPIPAQATEEDEEEHAALHLHALQGETQCQLHFQGGVSILLPHPQPEIGNPSTGMKLTSVSFKGHQLIIEADLIPAAGNTFRIRTPWHLAAIEGATANPLPGQTYSIEPASPNQKNSNYFHVKMDLTFNP